MKNISSLTDRATVLVADDDLIVRTLLQKSLAKLGHRVLLAGTGEKAVELVASDHPSVVLLDVHMPGMGGLEALKAIVEAHPETIVVMLTAEEDPQIAEFALRCGATDYLTKPIEQQSLEKILRTHLFFSGR